jgi:hypothetical protein
MSDEALVAAARGLRDEKPELLAAAGDEVGPALDRLLRQADAGQEVSDDIIDLLAADASTRDELQRRLARTDVRGVAFGDLPGRPDPADAIWYECPRGDYRYPVFELGEPVPDCPNGHGPLRRM